MVPAHVWWQHVANVLKATFLSSSRRSRTVVEAALTDERYCELGGSPMMRPRTWAIADLLNADDKRRIADVEQGHQDARPARTVDELGS